MNFIHYTTEFENKVLEDPKRDLIYRKLEELSAVDKPESLNSVDPYAKGILVLKFVKTNTCRIIIQTQNVEVAGNQFHVLFIRDYISKKGFDYFWGSVTYPHLSSGDWLNNNPLPEEEIERFRKRILNEKQGNQSLRPALPSKLTEWLDDFRIKLIFDVYEREDWVKYSNDQTVNGLSEKYLIIFRDTIKAILNEPSVHKVSITPINESNNVYRAINEPFQIGIIFSDFADIDGKRIILLHDGAHLIQQRERWELALAKAEKDTYPVIGNLLEISKDAFRAYPKWIVTNENEELWISIEKYEGSNNLSLLPEQVIFLNQFKFPAYINGQAGSGKSTMLYYLFANVYFYKCVDAFDGDIIFLTENDTLLEHTSKCILGLLSSNPEFNLGLTIEQRDNIRQHFSSFVNFLLYILPEEDRKNYPLEKYLNFSRFKELYNTKLRNKKYSAEEAWFVISTYVFGYYENETIETVAKYEDEKTGIPSKFRIINSERFSGIIEQTLPFYKKLIDQGWWDRSSLVRKIWHYYPISLPKEYTVVFCDEAQDFSRIELRLILRASKYTKYDLSGATQIPVVLAGDALQTVSPTGFSDVRLHQMYYEVFNEAKFHYDKKSATYNPRFNYRSGQPIVRLANLVQNYRKESLKEDVFIKQEAKRANDGIHRPMLHYKEWLIQDENRPLFIKKFKYKSFIIPIDLNEENDFVQSDSLLTSDFSDVKSSIDAKGAEYSQVVVYGFGDYYIEELGKLSWRQDNYDFKTKFFFNKLYVAITRAQNELIIIDSERACNEFWKPLLNIPSNVTDKWEVYTDINDIVLINPETGLQNIKESTPEDALNNAIVDMEQGISDQNAARLIVASNVFLMLGKIEEANTCLGHKESIAGKWQNAGDFFLKAKKMDEAANAFFHGKAWATLEQKTNSLQGAKQEARLLVARLMQNDAWEKEELDKIYALRNVLGEILYNIGWYADYSSKIKAYAQRVTGHENKRTLAFVLESIIRDGDLDLWMIIGRLYFDTKQYSNAIEAWGKKINTEKTPEYFPEYAIAHVERAMDEHNLHDEILWSGRLLGMNISLGDKTKYSKKIVAITKEKSELISSSPAKAELYQHAFYALVLLGDISKLSEIATYVESSNQEPDKLTSIYRSLIKDCKHEEISVFLKERWAKAKIKELGYSLNKNESELIIEKLNKDFKSQKFPFEDSNSPWIYQELKEIPDIPQPISSEPNLHFENFSLSNFRAFEDIKLSNIGQFNLILGDNNVGKTSLLEALLFSPNPDKCLLNFLYAIKQRNNNAQGAKDYLLFKSLLTQSSSENHIKFTLKNGRKIWSYVLRYPSTKELFEKFGVEGLEDKQYLVIETNGSTSAISNRIESLSSDLDNPNIFKDIPFIPFGKGYSEKISSVYQSEIGSKRANIAPFVEQMKLFIPKIVYITLDPETQDIRIVVDYNGRDYDSSLADFGEGANKLFRILVQLHAAKDRRLMIDEIDAGIHYSRFKPFWKIILQTAKDYNVQLFATTHNEECIKLFWEVIKGDEFVDFRNLSRIITLDRHIKTREIIPIVRDFDNMMYSSENQLEIRGQR